MEGDGGNERMSDKTNEEICENCKHLVSEHYLTSPLGEEPEYECEHIGCNCSHLEVK